MYNTIDEIVTKLNAIYSEACDLYNSYNRYIINSQNKNDLHKILHIMFDNSERKLSHNVLKC